MLSNNYSWLFNLSESKDKMAPAIEQTKDNPNQKDPKDPASWLSLPVVMVIFF